MEITRLDRGKHVMATVRSAIISKLKDEKRKRFKFWLERNL